MMSYDKKWFDQLLEKARLGSLQDMIAVGWEFSKGDITEKDVESAFLWFDRAEKLNAPLARFNKAKMMYIQNILGWQKIIEHDAINGYGPSAYLTAIININSDDPSYEYYIRNLEIGSNSGHIPSKIMLFRKSKWSLIYRIARIPGLALATFRFFLVGLRDPMDPKILD